MTRIPFVFRLLPSSARLGPRSPLVGVCISSVFAGPVGAFLLDVDQGGAREGEGSPGPLREESCRNRDRVGVSEHPGDAVRVGWILSRHGESFMGGIGRPTRACGLSVVFCVSLLGLLNVVFGVDKGLEGGIRSIPVAVIVEACLFQGTRYVDRSPTLYCHTTDRGSQVGAHAMRSDISRPGFPPMPKDTHDG